MALVLTGSPQFAVAPLSAAITYDTAFTAAVVFETGATVTGASAQVPLCITTASGSFRGFSITVDTDGYIKIGINASGSDAFGITPWTKVLATPNTIYRAVIRKAVGATGVVAGFVDSFTNTYSRAASSSTVGLTRIGLGTNLASANYRYFAGKVVRVAFWPSAISDADVVICLDKAKTPLDCSVLPRDYWLAVANDAPTLPAVGGSSISRSGGAVYDSSQLLTPVISSITDPISVGGSFSFTGANWAGGTFTAITNNVTGGTISAITGDTTSGSATIAGWSNGSVYDILPKTATFTFNDGTGTKTTSSTVTVPVDFSKIILDTPAFIAKTLANEVLAQTGRTVATGDIFFPKLYAGLTIFDDSDWTATNGGTFDLWLRIRDSASVDAGKMFYYNVTITDSGGVIIVNPDPFTFGTRTGVQLNTLTTGTTQAVISGVTPSIDLPATPSGGLENRVSTDGGTTFGSWLSSEFNVQLGYVVEGRLVSSSAYNTLLTGSLTIGTTVGTLQVTTRAQDVTPDAFSFGSVTGANPATVTLGANSATVAGVDADADVTAVPSGGLSYRVSTDDGVTFGSWLTGTSNVNLGHVIEARVTSSSSFTTLVTGTLTLNGVAGTLQVTTRAADTTPNAFSFGTATGVDISTVTVSGTRATISGVDGSVDISAVPSGGLSYRVSTDGGTTFGSWLTGTSNVQLGAVIEARVTSSGSYATLVTGTLTVGGVAGTFAVTTKASAVTPDNFTFESVVNVTPGAIVASPTTVTVSGVTPGVDIPIEASDGLSYRVSTDDGVTFGSWVETDGNVRLGYQVQVRLQASEALYTTTVGTLTIGGVDGTFTVRSWSSSGGGGSGSNALSFRVLRFTVL